MALFTAIVVGVCMVSEEVILHSHPYLSGFITLAGITIFLFIMAVGQVKRGIDGLVKRGVIPDGGPVGVIVGLLTGGPEAVVATLAVFNGMVGYATTNQLGSNNSLLYFILPLALLLVGKMETDKQHLRLTGTVGEPLLYSAIFALWLLASSSLPAEISSVVCGLLIVWGILALYRSVGGDNTRQKQKDAPGWGTLLKHITIGMSLLVYASWRLNATVDGLATFLHRSPSELGAWMSSNATNAPELIATLMAIWSNTLAHQKSRGKQWSSPFGATWLFLRALWHGEAKLDEGFGVIAGSLIGNTLVNALLVLYPLGTLRQASVMPGVLETAVTTALLAMGTWVWASQTRVLGRFYALCACATGVLMTLYYVM